MHPPQYQASSALHTEVSEQRWACLRQYRDLELLAEGEIFYRASEEGLLHGFAAVGAAVKTPPY